MLVSGLVTFAVELALKRFRRVQAASLELAPMLLKWVDTVREMENVSLMITIPAVTLNISSAYPVRIVAEMFAYKKRLIVHPTHQAARSATIKFLSMVIVKEMGSAALWATETIVVLTRCTNVLRVRFRSPLFSTSKCKAADSLFLFCSIYSINTTSHFAYCIPCKHLHPRFELSMNTMC